MARGRDTSTRPRSALTLAQRKRGTGVPSPAPRPTSPAPLSGIGTVRWPRVVPKDLDCAESLKKRTLTNLYNQRPAWLELAHEKLDAAVFAAYGWEPGMSDDELLERLLQTESRTLGLTFWSAATDRRFPWRGSNFHATPP